MVSGAYSLPLGFRTSFTKRQSEKFNSSAVSWRISVLKNLGRLPAVLSISAFFVVTHCFQALTPKVYFKQRFASGFSVGWGCGGGGGCEAGSCKRADFLVFRVCLPGFLFAGGV